MRRPGPFFSDVNSQLVSLRCLMLRKHCLSAWSFFCFATSAWLVGCRHCEQSVCSHRDVLFSKFLDMIKRVSTICQEAWFYHHWDLIYGQLHLVGCNCTLTRRLKLNQKPLVLCHKDLIEDWLCLLKEKKNLKSHYTDSGLKNSSQSELLVQVVWKLWELWLPTRTGFFDFLSIAVKDLKIRPGNRWVSIPVLARSWVLAMLSARLLNDLSVGYWFFW
jgi:hypothetical protein